MMQAFPYRHLVPAKGLEVCLVARPQLRFELKILDPTPIKIPAGGTVAVRVRAPARATNNFHLELDHPPEGISIAKIAAGEGETKIVFQSDAAKIKAGTTGNLIVDIATRRGRGKQQQSIVVGSLPAIPFEIVKQNDYSASRPPDVSIVLSGPAR